MIDPRIRIVYYRILGRPSHIWAWADTEAREIYILMSERLPNGIVTIQRLIFP
jgi:hypothetical protein